MRGRTKGRPAIVERGSACARSLVRKLLVSGVLVLLALAGGGILFARSLNAPAYQGPVTEHFDGAVFRNFEPVALPGLGRGIRYLFSTDPGPWDDWRENPPSDEVVRRSKGLRITFINHATTLLQLDSLNKLDWNEATTIGPLRITSETCRHFSGRGWDDLQKTLWVSYVIEALRLVFTSRGTRDTGPIFGTLAIVMADSTSPSCRSAPISHDGSWEACT